MVTNDRIIIGIDAGTSVIKAVAFTPDGRMLDLAAVRNVYATGADGAATQSMARTWEDCARAIRALGEKVEGLARRTLAVAVTAQGDGTWLVDGANAPVGDAWIWLDARAAPTVARLSAAAGERARFETTGTGLNTCQQGAQLAHMAVAAPELLARADCALHCKDWLYLNLTGVRATDPSEAAWTFGDFRSRAYDEGVIEALGLSAQRRLLPEIIDGTQLTHPLSPSAAAATGLLAGTPVTLGFVDMVMTGLGAGVYDRAGGAACTVIGSTGVHMRAVPAGEVTLNEAGTGYIMALPVPGMVTQMQSNMAATLNIDWALGVAEDLAASLGMRLSHAQLVNRIEDWLAETAPAQLLYHPYISEAGERGPFTDAEARAGFYGLSAGHRFPDMLRAVIEGLGLAARDCFEAMGEAPSELRLTGGAARSQGLRGILGAAIGTATRVSDREETGAAGAAMMAAVASGVYPDMAACADDWVSPLLGPAEPHEPALHALYDRQFTTYRTARKALGPVWSGLALSRAAAQTKGR